MNVFEEQRGQIALYAAKGSRECATIVILLEQLKLPYRLRLVAKPGDVHDHQILPPGVRSLPLLTNFQSDGEHVSLCDTNSILAYLISRYDEHHVVTYPKDTAQDTEMNNWLALVLPHHNQHQEASPPRINLEAQDGIAITRKALSLYLNLERHLQKTGSRYLVGNKCTVADFAHFPYVAAAGSMGLDLERFPELTSWHNRLIEEASVIKGMRAVGLKVAEE